MDNENKNNAFPNYSVTFQMEADEKAREFFEKMMREHEDLQAAARQRIIRLFDKFVAVDGEKKDEAYWQLANLFGIGYQLGWNDCHDVCDAKDQVGLMFSKWHEDTSDESILPPYDEEVIALEAVRDRDGCVTGYRIGFAHRPDPRGYDGKSIVSGEVSRYEPKLYGDGGWNVPVTLWMKRPPLPKEYIVY